MRKRDAELARVGIRSAFGRLLANGLVRYINHVVKGRRSDTVLKIEKLPYDVPVKEADFTVIALRREE